MPTSDDICNLLKNNNVFTIAKRNVEGQDMLYQSIKLTNNIWILAELKLVPGNAIITVRMTFRHILALYLYFFFLILVIIEIECS